VFGEYHGNFSPISLPRCSSILLLNSCCLGFFTFAWLDLVRKKLFASGSVSEDLYVGVIVPFCCFSNVDMNGSVVEEVDNSRIWICLLHLCDVVVFYSNLFFTEVSFRLQHFLDPVSHVTSISLLLFLSSGSYILAWLDLVLRRSLVSDLLPRRLMGPGSGFVCCIFVMWWILFYYILFFTEDSFRSQYFLGLYIALYFHLLA
jgi:hypothetical protein